MTTKKELLKEFKKFAGRPVKVTETSMPIFLDRGIKAGRQKGFLFEGKVLEEMYIKAIQNGYNFHMNFPKIKDPVYPRHQSYRINATLVQDKKKKWRVSNKFYFG